MFFTDEEIEEIARICIIALSVGIHSKGNNIEEEPIFGRCLAYLKDK